jgi:hypothetical protein
MKTGIVGRKHKQRDLDRPDLPDMANQILEFGCGKSTRQANHF